MEQLEEIIEETVQFLREFWGISEPKGKITFSKVYERVPPATQDGQKAIGEGHVKTRVAPGDYAEAAFLRSTKNVQRINEEELWRQQIATIPDKPYQIVVVGRAMLNPSIAAFLRSHPNAHAHIIDTMSSAEFYAFYINDDEIKPAGFDHAVPVGRKFSWADAVQQLFHANKMSARYSLVQYDDQRKYDDQLKGVLENALQTDRETRILALQASPAVTAYLVSYLGRRHNIMTWLGIRDLQTVNKGDDLFARIVFELGVSTGITDQELEGYHSLLHDKGSQPGTSSKYPSQEYPQWRFGMMLKLLSYAAIANELTTQGYTATLFMHQWTRKGDFFMKTPYHHPGFTILCA